MTIQESRKLLGRLGETMSDREIEELTFLYESLASSWLDDYEKTVFQGKTIKQLLTTRGQKEVSWL